MAYRYVADNTAVKALRAEPCTSILDANLTNAVNQAEDKVDLYLSRHNVTTPVTGDAITDDLKEAVAVMAQAVIYYSFAGQWELGQKCEKQAEAILDRYIAATDLDLPVPPTEPAISNYQENFIDDWNEPSDAAEEMDV